MTSRHSFISFGKGVRYLSQILWRGRLNRRGYAFSKCECSSADKVDTVFFFYCSFSATCFSEGGSLIDLLPPCRTVGCPFFSQTVVKFIGDGSPFQWVRVFNQRDHRDLFSRKEAVGGQSFSILVTLAVVFYTVCGRTTSHILKLTKRSM